MKKKDRIYLSSIAGLFHQIGKIGVIGGALSENELKNQGDILNNFISGLVDLFPKKELIKIISNFSSPSSPLEWVVAEACCLAIGKDEKHTDSGIIQVESILSNVYSDKKSPSDKRYLPVNQLKLEKDYLFPTSLDNQSSKGSCREIWDGLRDRLKALTEKAELSYNFFLLILQLFERYTSQISCFIGESSQDISFYDHARVTSAICACLAFYDDSEKDEKFVRDRYDSRYSLVCVDISGIQRYINALKSEGARRSLTGRSFFVQLIEDAIAASIPCKFDLPPTCVIYRGGGKVWFLLPSQEVDDDFCKFIEEVDLFLWSETGGLLSVGYGESRLNGNDFIRGKIGEKWGEALITLKQNRLRRFRHLEYEKIFGLGSSGLASCEQCGNETTSDSCKHCEMTEQIGRILGKKDQDLVISRVYGEEPNNADVSFPHPLNIFYVFHAEKPSNSGVKLLIDPRFLDERFDMENLCWPVATSEPVQFSDLARKNISVPRLGVLRADVDSLGAIFDKGFPKEKQTLSRLAALSRSLSLFFGAYFPKQLRQRWSDIKIVFSGGDDCFLLGPFHLIPGVAKFLHDEFYEYTANNSEITISVGIAIQDENAPFISTARSALIAEQKAKSYKRGVNGSCEKDAVCMFGIPVSWTEFKRAGDIVARLLKSIKNIEPIDGGLEMFVDNGVQLPTGNIHRSIVHKLGHAVAMYQATKSKDLSTIGNAGQWMWLTDYYLSRAQEWANNEMKAFLNKLLEDILDLSQRPGTDSRGLIEYLSLVVDWTHLLTRSG